MLIHLRQIESFGAAAGSDQAASPTPLPPPPPEPLPARRRIAALPVPAGLCVAPYGSIPPAVQQHQPGSRSNRSPPPERPVPDRSPPDWRCWSERHRSSAAAVVAGRYRRSPSGRHRSLDASSDRDAASTVAAIHRCRTTTIGHWPPATTVGHWPSVTTVGHRLPTNTAHRRRPPANTAHRRRRPPPPLLATGDHRRASPPVTTATVGDHRRVLPPVTTATIGDHRPQPPPVTTATAASGDHCCRRHR
ncbi:chromosome alignment-maintaining phosphoprotein 1-like [Zingiber officinale]|uniref:chromosome alignment-maintaining phosphoprotein 1-like n=1 Tax=Zingiber officinale TaxID=94328 RepID=UPI001C4D4444|nr:chromosome alignment-maintaining phosphoprotein 1-like [Zingiber officinale]